MGRVRRLRHAGRAARLSRRGGRGGRRAGGGARRRGRRRLGRALEAVSPAVPGSGAGMGAPSVVGAADRDHRRGRGSRTGLRHRLSRDHPALSGAAAGPGASRARSPTSAAAPACSRSWPRSSGSGRSPRSITTPPRWRPRARTPGPTGWCCGEVERHDLRRTPPPQAQTVVANLMRPLLLCVADLMEPRPRALILSGLLDEEAKEVAAAFAPLRERRRLSSLGWSALLLAHP